IPEIKARGTIKIDLSRLQPSEEAAINFDAFQMESEVRSYCRSFDATFVGATGSIMIDSKGRRFIDFLGGASALNYGHNDPDMADALVNYVKSGGIAHSLDLHSKSKALFMDTFNRLVLTPRSMLYRLQFTGPTGTNAIEAALKLARKVTGRTEVVAFTNGFHGMSLGALAATGNKHHRIGSSIQLPGVIRAFYDGYFGADIDTAAMLDKALSDPSSGFDAPAAILLETVQGEGGLNTASAEWMQKIADIAKRHGALLIIDDIQAGCGRTGSFFSFEPLGIEPDIVVLSKSLSGFGLPLSLVLIRPEYDRWLPGEHNGTFRGNNLAFVTATTALDKYWSDTMLMGDVKRRGMMITEALGRMACYVPGAHIKGRGMMLGLDVGDGKLASAVSLRCFETGLIVERAGPRDEVIKILAPLTTPDSVLKEGLSILSSAMEKVSPRFGV
ncbi:partial diaminobutyrate-2-oxoglutarate transaminase, partial [biofilm metagenome]